MLNETPPSSTDELRKSLTHLSEELERFRGTRTTRKFNLEDVECYFVYFYSLRTIGEAIIKMDEQVRSIDTD